MKERFLVGSMVLVALTLASAARAQVGVGIKGGVNLATVSGLTNASNTQRVGLTAGAFLTFGLAPFIAFEPEVLFSMQGSKLQSVTTKVDYIQVPLLLRVGNSGKRGASLYVIGGPTFGVLARHSGVADELKSTDFGVVVGTGVSLSRLLFEGRYTTGLTDFNKGGTVYKNRVLSLLVGLHF